MERNKLFEHLNEILTVEKFAAESYQQTAQQAREEEVKLTLREFAKRVERHRKIVSDLIEALGAGPAA